MKKHVLAVAVAAAVSMPAVAQVTVSGTLDVAATRSLKESTMAGSGSTTVTTAESKGTGSGSLSGTTTSSTVGYATSEMIFQATEDLGGGLKATARYSQNIGNETMTARDRYIDVAGGFGSVRLGRFNAFTGNFNNFSGAGTTNQAGDLNDFTTGGAETFQTALTNASFERQSGLIQYTSPSFNGFTVSAGYGNNSNDTTTTASSLDESKTTYLGVEYKAGPLTIQGAMSEKKNKTRAVAGTAGKAWFTNGTHNATGTQSTASATTLGDATTTNGYSMSSTLAVPQTGGATPGVSGLVTSAGIAAVSAAEAKHEFDWLGASYNLGPATLMAATARRKTESGSVGSAATTSNDAKVNAVGLMVPLGATTLRASVYDGKDERATGATDDMKLEGHQVSVTYNLSKRTYLYGVMGESEVKREGSATSATRTNKSNAIGVVHTF